MDKFDPGKWSSSYVKKHEDFCVDVLERMTGAMEGALADGEYMIAAQCCNKACDGLILLAGSVNSAKYTPMFYSYSFVLSQIVLFGLGGEKGLRAAIPSLEDAYEYVLRCLRSGFGVQDKVKRDAELIGSFIEDIKAGMPLASVKNKYCPDFPHNIIG